jgi:hypothetical protein
MQYRQFSRYPQSYQSACTSRFLSRCPSPGLPLTNGAKPRATATWFASARSPPTSKERASESSCSHVARKYPAHANRRPGTNQNGGSLIQRGAGRRQALGLAVVRSLSDHR